MPKAIPKSSDGPQAAPGRKRKLHSDEGPSSPPQAMRPVRAVNVVRTVQHRPATGRGGTMSSTTRRTPSPAQRSSTVSSTTSPPEPSPSVAGTSNFLLEALRRIRELQDELDFLQNDPYAEDTDDDGDNDGDEEEEEEQEARGMIGGQRAEAVGWAVCARETMHFLQREGIPPDSPLMVNLRRRLIGCPGDPLPDEGLSC
uniref:Uncharacterized protein n=1 Tax=Anopheles atroparvus TaxID=41427 RepID=A0A182J2S9_ANOAO